MPKKILKGISIVLGLISIYWAIELIPNRTDRSLIAFNGKYVFEKELIITEKFKTNFESSYAINFSLEEPRPYENLDSLRPTNINIEIFHKNEQVEIFENNSFLSESGAEYELKIKFINANSKPNTFRIGIQTDVPGPTYELLIEKEFEWLFWIINGIIMLIAVITGYIGFQKKR